MTVATHWLVPGPGVVQRSGDRRTPPSRAWPWPIPGRPPAQVEVTTLGQSRPWPRSSSPPAGWSCSAPRWSAALSAYSVLSSQPVDVEEDSRPSGASGVVSSTGFPFVG